MADYWLIIRVSRFLDAPPVRLRRKREARRLGPTGLLHLLFMLL